MNKLEIKEASFDKGTISNLKIGYGIIGNETPYQCIRMTGCCKKAINGMLMHLEIQETNNEYRGTEEPCAFDEFYPARKPDVIVFMAFAYRCILNGVFMVESEEIDQIEAVPIFASICKTMLNAAEATPLIQIVEQEPAPVVEKPVIATAERPVIKSSNPNAGKPGHPMSNMPGEARPYKASRMYTSIDDIHIDVEAFRGRDVKLCKQHEPGVFQVVNIQTTDENGNVHNDCITHNIYVIATSGRNALVAINNLYAKAIHEHWTLKEDPGYVSIKSE